jgi:hypothetical protein
MKKILFAVLAVTTFMSFTSCKKSEDATCTLSASTITGTYKITSLKLNGVDLFPLSDACDKDDTFTLNANGSFIITDAGVVCTPSNNDTGTWSLAGSTISIDGDTGNVSNFSCNGFTVSATQAGATTEVTYARQ